MRCVFKALKLVKLHLWLGLRLGLCRPLAKSVGEESVRSGMGEKESEKEKREKGGVGVIWGWLLIGAHAEEVSLILWSTLNGSTIMTMMMMMKDELTLAWR